MAKELNLEIHYDTWSSENITIPDEFDGLEIDNIDIRYDEGHVYFVGGDWYSFTINNEPHIDYKYPTKINSYDKDWNTVGEYDG